MVRGLGAECGVEGFLSLVATSGSFGRRVSGSGFWDTGVGIRVSGLGEELQSHKTDLRPKAREGLSALGSVS